MTKSKLAPKPKPAPKPAFYAAKPPELAAGYRPPYDLLLEAIELLTSEIRKLTEVGTLFGKEYILETTFIPLNTIDFIGTHGGSALFLQVTNMDSSNSIVGQLNGQSNITFTLAANETQIFNRNDIAIRTLALKSINGNPKANVIASVRTVEKKV
jgi:hypothetical protein